MADHVHPTAFGQIVDRRAGAGRARSATGCRRGAPASLIRYETTLGGRLRGDADLRLPAREGQRARRRCRDSGSMAPDQERRWRLSSGAAAGLGGHLPQPPRQRRRQRARLQPPAPVARRAARGRSSAPRCRGRARPGPAPSPRAPARRARAGSAPTTARRSRIPRARELGVDERRASRRVERLDTSRARVVVVGARCRRPGRSTWFSRRCGLSRLVRVEAELQHDHPGQAELVAQPLDRRRDHAEVLGDQRQRRRARARAASNSARPGPRRQRPPTARRVRPRAPPSRRRSRGSGRSARGRTARACAAAARPTSGSRRRRSAGQS